jgi:ribonuclease HII
VAGVDEVGRGAWAGPLGVGVVILDPARLPAGLADSKLLSAQQRERLAGRIAGSALGVSVGYCQAQECDLLGMAGALRLAAARALANLQPAPDVVLVDGASDFVADGRSRAVVDGDASSVSIAAASIVAKVCRDAVMSWLGRDYPDFDFASNKGYGSRRHEMALRRLGPTPLHRMSWSYLDRLGIRGT